MSVFLLGDIKITDESWLPEYASSVHHIVHKHGGKFLTRSSNIKVLQGEPEETRMIAIIEFPDADSVEAFLSDPDYKTHGAARTEGSESRVLLIDQSDFVGTIPYLGKS